MKVATCLASRSISSPSVILTSQFVSVQVDNRDIGYLHSVTENNCVSSAAATGVLSPLSPVATSAYGRRAAS